MKREKRDRIPGNIITFNFKYFNHNRRVIIASIVLGISILVTGILFAMDTYRLNTHIRVVGSVSLVSIEDGLIMTEVTYEIDGITYTGIANIWATDDRITHLLVNPNDPADFRQFNPRNPHAMTGFGVLFILIYAPVFLILIIKKKFSNKYSCEK